ncbi:MAG: holo-ACP synthase [candidate division KSB1 bacterium]
MICGLGLDLVEIARMKALLARWDRRFLEKIFTAEEIAACEPRGHRAASYAARFAAKEACAKALGTGWDRNFAWKDFSVRNEASGRPLPILSPRLQARLAGINIHLSLSHTEHYATALVIFEKAAP